MAFSTFFPSRWQIYPILFLSLFPSFSPAQDKTVSTASERPLSNANLLLLEMSVGQQLLTDNLNAYQYGNNVLLPLGEIARQLTIAIQVQPEKGLATGFILREDRPFSLDVKQAKFVIGNLTQEIDPKLVKVQPDDIYIASQLLSKILPIDLFISLSSLALQVKPREPLPLQLRLERERLSTQLGSREKTEEAYPRRASPYRFAEFPFIDQTIGVNVNRSNGVSQTNVNSSTYITGDLFGLESSIFVSGTREDGLQKPRATFGRHDPNATLLGPLQARKFEFGDVSLPGISNISASTTGGRGISISNSPLSRPTRFDRHTLQGPLPPGWDVELYFNDVLVGFQQSRPDGQYVFADQPLVYGSNQFRLVFHGPQGQLRVERQNFLLEDSLIPPGDFYYNIGAQRSTDGKLLSLTQLEWGLGKHLSASGALVRLPVNGVEQSYANIALRGFWNSIIFSGNLSKQQNAGNLAEISINTRLGNFSIGASHLRVGDNFTSEVFSNDEQAVSMRDTARIDGYLPFKLANPISVTLEGTRDRLRSGLSNTSLTNTIASTLFDTSMSNQIQWQSNSGVKLASGSFQLGRSFGAIGLRGQVNYFLDPDRKISSVALAADRSLGEGYQLNMELTRAFGTSSTQLTTSVNKNMGTYALGVNASYVTTHDVSLGVQFFTAIGKEPRSSTWVADAIPMADSGSVSAQVFLDKNMNGIKDSDEEALKDIGFTVNGGVYPVRTDNAGIAYLGHLPVNQNVDIGINQATLEDPQWIAQPKGVRLIPRPGKVNKVDFPIVLTGEIDGTVYFNDKDKQRGIGDVQLELVNTKGVVISRVKSASDGYFIIPAVTPGKYLLRIAKQQLKQLKMADTGMHLLTMSPNGAFINGANFVLSSEQ